jgi:hypothetical protein
MAIKLAHIHRPETRPIPQSQKRENAGNEWRISSKLAIFLANKLDGVTFLAQTLLTNPA